MSEAQYRIEVFLYAMLSSPMVLSFDLGTLVPSSASTSASAPVARSSSKAPSSLHSTVTSKPPPGNSTIDSRSRTAAARSSLNYNNNHNQSFTIALLLNKEIVAINQDKDGIMASKVFTYGRNPVGECVHLQHIVISVQL